jgi:hypothetical protein
MAMRGAPPAFITTRLRREVVVAVAGREGTTKPMLHIVVYTATRARTVVCECRVEGEGRDSELRKVGLERWLMMLMMMRLGKNARSHEAGRTQRFT